MPEDLEPAFVIYQLQNEGLWDISETFSIMNTSLSVSKLPDGLGFVVYLQDVRCR